MRISAKARYGLAAMIYFGLQEETHPKLSVLEVSEALNISKIYLEQVFSQLKAAGIVHAVKGPQGGYSLSRSARDITAYDVLSATETSLFDVTPETVSENASHIEEAMYSQVFDRLDQSVKAVLSEISIAELAETAYTLTADGYMYYL